MDKSEPGSEALGQDAALTPETPDQTNPELPKVHKRHTILYICLVLLALVAVGCGYAYYHYHHAREASAKQPIVSRQSKSTPSNKAQQITYLDVKEWGVKLPLSAAIKDAYYVVATNSTDTIWLGLKSLDNTCAVSLGNTEGASAVVGSLLNPSATDHEPVSGKLYSQLYPGVTIGGHYVAYVNHPNASHCASTSRLKTIDSAFGTAAKGAVSDTTNTNVVKIPELGIQLTVADDIKDLVYKVGTTTLRNGNPATYVTLSTASLTAAEPSCGPSFGPLGSLERASGQYPDVSTGQFTPIDFGVLEAQFPTFYISADFPQAACAVNPPPYDRGAFGSALSTIQPLK